MQIPTNFWGKSWRIISINLLYVVAKLCKRMFLTYSLMQISHRPGRPIHFIWEFMKKYIFRRFATRYLFLPFKPLRHNRMMLGFLGGNTEIFPDLNTNKKIPFSGGRPAEQYRKRRSKIFFSIWIRKDIEGFLSSLGQKKKIKVNI